MKLAHTGAFAAALVLTAGAATAQPPTVTYEISYTSQPHGGFPLYFGDYARIVVNASFSPPVGTIISYTTPNGPHSGPVAGLGMLYFDILGCDMVGGTWTLSGSGFAGTTGNTWGVRSGWSWGQPGMPQSNGDILGIVAGQFPNLPGATVNPVNPVSELWRARWDYGSFISGRWLRLTIYPRDTSIIVRYGTDGAGQPLYDLVPAAASPAALEIFMDSGPPGPCTAAVVTQPASRSAYTNDTAFFHVGAQWYNPQGNCGNFTYAWRRDCQTLANGGNISGADTELLRISPVTPADAGQYDVRVNGNHSSTAMLTVLCYANCDASTTPPVLNINDFTCFLNSFAAGNAYANCDHSTSAPVLNVLDFTCFLNQFASGCP